MVVVLVAEAVGVGVATVVAAVVPLAVAVVAAAAAQLLSHRRRSARAHGIGPCPQEAAHLLPPPPQVVQRPCCPGHLHMHVHRPRLPGHALLPVTSGVHRWLPLLPKLPPQRDRARAD